MAQRSYDLALLLQCGPSVKRELDFTKRRFNRVYRPGAQCGTFTVHAIDVAVLLKYIVDEGLIDEVQSSIGMAEDECGSLESAVGDIQSYVADASSQMDDMKSQLVDERESSLEQFLAVLDSEVEDLKHRVKERLQSELGVE